MSQISAAGARRRRGRGVRRLLAAATSTAVLAVGSVTVTVHPAAAAAPVTVDMVKLQHELFAAHLRQHSGNDSLKNLVLSAYMVGKAQHSPNLTSDQLISATGLFSNWWDKSLAPSSAEATLDNFNTALDLVAVAAPEGKIAIEILKPMYDSLTRGDFKEYDTWQNQVAGAKFQYQFMSKFYGAAGDIVAGKVLDLGQNPNAEFSKAWDSYFGSKLQVRTSSTVDELMADPTLTAMVNTKFILEQQAGSDGYLHEIMNQLATAEDSLHDQIAEVIKKQDAAAGEDIHVTVVTYPVGTTAATPPPSVEERAKAKAKERQATIDSIAAGIDVLAELAGFADPDAGRIVAGVGHAGIQIATAINNYLPEIAGKGLADALLSTSTLALTGNIAGAIGSLLPLFRAGAPTPEQQILAEVGKLRQDVSDLRTEMNQQFGQVNRSLSIIYSDMLTQFDQVLALQQATESRLISIQGSLDGIKQSIDAWGGEIVKSLGQIDLNDAHQAMDTYLDYYQKYGQPIPSYDQYVHAESTLHEAATDKVLNAPLVLSASSYPNLESDPGAVLDAYDRGGAAGFLAWYGKRHYGWPLVAADPAHPELTPAVAATADWLSIANGYQQLMAQNSGYAKQVNTAQASQIVSVGDTINKSAQALSAPRSPASADGTVTNPLYTGLVSDYRNAADAFQAQLKPLQKAQTGDKDYQLFGTADQALPAGQSPTDPGKVPACNSWPSQPSLTRPGNVTISNAPSALAFAQYAHPDGPKLRLCHTSGLADAETSSTGTWDITTANLQVTMQVELDWGNDHQVYTSWTRSWPLGVVCRQSNIGAPGGYCHDENYYLNKWDATYAPSFTATGTDFVQNDQVAANARTRMTQLLAGKQKAYYDAVVHDLQTAGTPLFGANAALTKALRLIQGYTQAGWATALRQDVQLQLVVNGAERLPGDTGDDTVITNIFRRAQANYSGCNPQGGAGSPCSSTTGYSPMAGQTYGWLAGCSAWASKAPLPADKLAADPVGNTVEAYAQWDAGFLGGLYEQHSKELAAHTYTEAVPEVLTTMSALSTTNTILHT
ncbi:hypothetical protein AB0K51_14895 [Kitasatospora sp. NPDC049285]|uniref:hypothetical protein n=1 Tax=Kitasatospora sp. NPDC049285 TaxID=3157096 RepID=UPI003427C235